MTETDKFENVISNALMVAHEESSKECMIDGCENQHNHRVNILPPNPLKGKSQKAVVCDDCKQEIEERNEVVSSIHSHLEFYAESLIFNQLGGSAGYPFATEIDDIDRISDINGIGPDTENRLIENGFETVRDLKEASAEELSAVDGVSHQSAIDIKQELLREAKRGR